MVVLAITSNDAYKKTIEDNFWEVLEEGAVKGFPVEVEYGGSTSHPKVTNDIFIREGIIEIDKEDLIPKYNLLDTEVKDFIDELIDHLGYYIQENEKFKEKNQGLKTKINLVKAQIQKLKNNKKRSIK